MLDCFMFDVFVCFVCGLFCDVVWSGLFVCLRDLCEGYCVRLSVVLRVLFVCGSWD